MAPTDTQRGYVVEACDMIIANARQDGIEAAMDGEPRVPPYTWRQKRMRELWLVGYDSIAGDYKPK